MYGSTMSPKSLNVGGPWANRCRDGSATTARNSSAASKATGEQAAAQPLMWARVWSVRRPADVEFHGPKLPEPRDGLILPSAVS
jgi:hypothetical protein